jgi:ribosomal protein L11 methyltransferase
MREVRLRVPAAAVEQVLDQLLPLVPGGVREVPDGEMVELKMRGDELPAISEIARAAERWPHRVTEAEVPDDWRVRRALDYVPDTIGGRLVVRPEWAPATPEAEIEIVLADHTGAFGAGTHPTTRVCLELLLELEPAGKFADLGCGSGVLAILAAKRGWEPVVAVDVQPASVEATRQNAAANRVAIDATVGDLSLAPPPAADGFAANVPAHLHALVAGALPDPRPVVALLSGFGRGDADATVGAYAACGFRELHRSEPHGWVVSLLERGR